jgi:hypothetical protein
VGNESSSNVATATIRGRLLDCRYVGIYFALALVWPVLIAFAVRGLVHYLATPDVGIGSSARLTVARTDGRWPGVDVEDQILSVGGTSVSSPTDYERVRRDLALGPVTMRFRRGEREWAVTADATPLGAAPKTGAVVQVISGAVLAIIGMLAFALRPGPLVSWLFMLLCYALAGLIVIPWWTAGVYTVPGVRVMIVLLLLASALCIHLFALFPRPVLPMVRGRRWLAWYAFAAFLAPPHVLSYPRPEWRRIWGLVDRVGRASLVVAVLVSVVLLIVQYRRARAERDAALLPQYRALAIAAAVGLFPAAAGAMILNTASGSHLVKTAPAWFYGFSVTPVGVFVALTAYVLVRHNALGVDKFTAAVVGHLGALGVVALGLGLAVIGLSLSFGTALAGSPTTLIVVTALSVLAFQPVYRRLKRRIDDWFLASPTDLARGADVLRKLVETVQTTERADACRAALEAASQLHVERVELWTHTDDGESLRRELVSGEPPMGQDVVARNGALGRCIAAGTSGGVRGVSETLLPEDAQAELWSLHLALVVPVLAHGVTAGFLGVGRKRSGAAHDRDELFFLTSVAAQVGVALERSGETGRRVGRYRLERRLGVGGMAEVFLAWQLGPGGFERKVALKQPLPHLAEDRETVAMFLDEARIGAQLEHRNIVKIYEIDRAGRSWFIAMEYVEGTSLRSLLLAAKARGQVPVPAIAVAITMAILAALDHAHNRTDPQGQPLNVVHRDVKPGNVLVALDGGVKLVDFGIARAASKLAVTRTGAVKGTIPFMSPEQFAGQALDGRSDVYSTAAVLYELLTLVRAHDDGPSRTPPPKPSAAAPDLPDALDYVVMRGLAFAPDERFQSAAAMRTALAMTGVSAASEDEVAAWVAELEPADRSKQTLTSATRRQGPQ